MIHFTMILEDLILTATEVIENDDEIVRTIHVHVCDSLSGENGKAIWTKEQWQAVLHLIANDDESGPMVDHWYKIAETAMQMIPRSCRIIP